jgi:hypothetical protein
MHSHVHAQTQTKSYKLKFCLYYVPVLQVILKYSRLQYYCEAVFPDLLRVHGRHIQQKCDFMAPLKDYKYYSGPV